MNPSINPAQPIRLSLQPGFRHHRWACFEYVFTPKCIFYCLSSRNPEDRQFFFDMTCMENVGIQLDLMNLAAAVAQQENFPATCLPVLRDSLRELASLPVPQLTETASLSSR